MAASENAPNSLVKGLYIFQSCDQNMSKNKKQKNIANGRVSMP